MPKVQRTPPASPPRAQSESDSSAVDKVVETRKIPIRSKRLRVEGSPQTKFDDQGVLQEFKNDLMVMLRAWKAEQDETLSKLVTDIAYLKSQCAEIQKSNSDIENSISFMNAQHEEFKEKIATLETEKRENRAFMTGLQKQFEELHQLSRPSSIEIRNVPEKDKESEGELISLVKKLGTTLDITIQDNDISDIYRRPGKPGTVKAIVTEFNSVQVKNNLLASSRRFNKDRSNSSRFSCEHFGMVDDKRPVYVDEHLPYSVHYRANTISSNLLVTHNYVAVTGPDETTQAENIVDKKYIVTYSSG
ncbi:unnamed protein product [Chilo suppressalis]|uniref:Zinc finger DNA binding protein n=1 Tax=Chilo suppressalis TaxID=168631 RepID=A0ABN8APK9_CHISP|nr:unnamed protein product [Chilo suppressalis]